MLVNLETKIMKKEPIISVIVCVYCAELYIKQCLESLINQTLREIEIILIIDEIAENTCCIDICKKFAAYDDRIIIKLKPEGSIVSARNVGLQIASAEWIMFVDSDDWIQSNMCEVLYKAAVKYEGQIVCSDAYKMLNGNSKIESMEKLNGGGDLLF